MSTTETTSKFTNEIIEDHGDWLLVDISTPKFPDATMAVDTDVFDAREGGRVYALCSEGSKYIYARYANKRRIFLTHRDVIHVPVGMLIDHITHGTMSFIDNRRCNLRLATRSQNNINQGLRNDNTSGSKGVMWHKENKKWVVGIKVDGKKLHLGCFEDIDDAIKARKQAEEKYFGEFAYYGGEK